MSDQKTSDIGRAFLTVLADPAVKWRETGAKPFIDRVSSEVASSPTATKSSLPAWALAGGLILGAWLGYSFGLLANEDAAFNRGYCAGLDIADTTCSKDSP